MSVLRSDVADLEEPCTRSKRESHEEWIAGPGKAPLMEKISVMFISIFVQ